MVRNRGIQGGVRCGLALTALWLLGPAAHAQTVRVSGGVGGEGNADSHSSAVSANGEWIAFTSDATNLVAGDVNGVADVFVREMSTGIVTLVSVGAFGQANAPCHAPTISADGRYIAFHSRANNLVAGDTNGTADVFRKDMTTGALLRISVDPLGVEAAGGSSVGFADGRSDRLAHRVRQPVRADTNVRFDVFSRDWCPPEWSNYGAGHPGTLGVPPIVLGADPIIGRTGSLSIGNSRGVATTLLLLVGFSSASIPTTLDGTIHLTVSSTFVLPRPATEMTLPFPIRDDPKLCGFEIFLQGLEDDPGASKGVSFTEGLRARFGR